MAGNIRADIQNVSYQGSLQVQYKHSIYVYHWYAGYVSLVSNNDHAE